jgi:hypothetical protein
MIVHFWQVPGRHLRPPPSEDQTWLSDRPLQVSLSIRDWVKTRRIDRDVKSIKVIRIEREGEAPIDIRRTGHGNQHELAAMPAGKSTTPQTRPSGDVMS